MNKLFLIASYALVLLISNNAISQDSQLKIIENWSDDSYYSEFLHIDLSPSFLYEGCSYIGVFGSHFRKINILFDNIYKKSDRIYTVIGKSMLKGKICEFSGTLTIERLELIHFDEKYSELWLTAVGDYKLIESDTNKGVFQGKFRKHLIYSYKSQTAQVADGHMELSTGEGFAGIWHNPENEKKYPCHFGFHRYPSDLAKGFDNWGGEPIINYKYKKYGWASHFTHKENPYLGYYSNVECDNQWWKE